MLHRSTTSATIWRSCLWAKRAPRNGVRKCVIYKSSQGWCWSRFHYHRGSLSSCSHHWDNTRWQMEAHDGQALLVQDTQVEWKGTNIGYCWCSSLRTTIRGWWWWWQFGLPNWGRPGYGSLPYNVQERKCDERALSGFRIQIFRFRHLYLEAGVHLACCLSRNASKSLTLSWTKI